MNNYFVILASGKGKRFHENMPKQYFQYKNKEIIVVDDFSTDNSSEIIKSINSDRIKLVNNQKNMGINALKL